MQDAGLVEMRALIAGFAVAAQRLARRLKGPGIVFLVAGGLIAGPGLVAPAEDFGALTQPMISLAVAIILFAGCPRLKLSDLREVGPGVGRLAVIGAPLKLGEKERAVVFAPVEAGERAA